MKSHPDIDLSRISDAALRRVGEKVVEGRRLDAADAVVMFRSPDLLGLGALVPCLLALGSNLPGYGLLWRHTPFHATRVPERLLPVASLCLAALVAVAIACVVSTLSRTRLVVVVADQPGVRHGRT